MSKTTLVNPLNTYSLLRQSPIPEFLPHLPSYAYGVSSCLSTRRVLRALLLRCEGSTGAMVQPRPWQDNQGGLSVCLSKFALPAPSRHEPDKLTRHFDLRSPWTPFVIRYFGLR